MSKIVLIKDVLNYRKRKDEELTRYRKHLEILQGKLMQLRKEIALTEQIINMVQKEEIVEIGSPNA